MSPDPRWRAWLVVYLKGAFMGAADTVPGVSGGTIALVTGIYDRLIAAVTALDPTILSHLPRVQTADGRAALRSDLVEMDVPFLAVLGGGIATSVLALSSLMHRAVNSPTLAPPTFAFFFGLIAASAVVLYRYVAVDTPARLGAGIAGFAIAWLVAGSTGGTPATSPPTVVLFFGGAVAVTAMILPGISGAFILLLLGLYDFMSGVPEEFVLALFAVARGAGLGAVVGPGGPLVAFLAGAVVGLFTVAHAVRWALDNYHEGTLTFLVALMVGALRAPARKIQASVGDWSPGTATAMALAAFVGVALVLGLDYYTDDLEY